MAFGLIMPGLIGGLGLFSPGLSNPFGVGIRGLFTAVENRIGRGIGTMCGAPRLGLGFPLTTKRGLKGLGSVELSFSASSERNLRGDEREGKTEVDMMNKIKIWVYDERWYKRIGT